MPVASYAAPGEVVTAKPNKKRRWLRWPLYAVGALVLLLMAGGLIQGFKDGIGSGDEPEVEPTSSCTDTTGDGDGLFDLTTADVQRIADGYVFSADYTGPADGRETSVTWTASVGEGDDWKAYMVSGGTYTDTPPDAWVFDVAATSNEYLTEFDVRPNSVRLTVPDDLIDDIAGEAFEWTATLSIDGADTDDCSAAFAVVA